MNGLLVEYPEVVVLHAAVYCSPIQRACGWACRVNGLLVEFPEVLHAVQRVFGMGMSGERLTG